MAWDPTKPTEACESLEAAEAWEPDEPAEAWLLSLLSQLRHGSLTSQLRRHWLLWQWHLYLYVTPKKYEIKITPLCFHCGVCIL